MSSLKEYRIEITGNNVLPKQLKHEAIERFGAYTTSSGVLAKGLNDVVEEGQQMSEQDSLLPKLIGGSPKKDNWIDKVNNYWSEFTVNISAVGLDISYPVNSQGKFNGTSDVHIRNYMICNHMKNHPDVAYHDAEIDNPDMYRATMTDLNTVRDNEKAESLKLAAGDTAFALLISELKKSENRERANLIAENNSIYNASKLSEDELIVELRKIKEIDPSSFKDQTEDENLKYRVLINKALTTSQMSQQGNTYYVGDKRLGDFEETLIYFKDDKNGIEINKLKDRINKSLTTTV